jgi:TolA-binding protein
VVAALAGTQYVQNLNQSDTITSLQANLSSLSTEVSTLNSQVAKLQANNSTSQKEIQQLQLQISQLENQSALLKQEVSLLGQVGGVDINSVAVNNTWTVQPNQTILVNQEVNQYNGSLVFIGYACPDGAGSSSNANGEQGMTVLLDSKSLVPLKSMNVELIGPQQWAVYLRNIGPNPVQCTGSLFYLYQTPGSP